MKMDKPQADRDCTHWLVTRNAAIDRYLRRKSGGGHNRKPIVINGVRYPSIRAAAVALGTYSAKAKLMGAVK